MYGEVVRSSDSSFYSSVRIVPRTCKSDRVDASLGAEQGREGPGPTLRLPCSQYYLSEGLTPMSVFLIGVEGLSLPMQRMSGEHKQG